MARKNSAARLTELPIVEVVWLDAATRTQWAKRKVHLHSGLVECASVGYLLAADPQVVVLAQSRNSEWQVGESLTIPRGSVVSMRRRR